MAGKKFRLGRMPRRTKRSLTPQSRSSRQQRAGRPNKRLKDVFEIVSLVFKT